MMYIFGITGGSGAGKSTVSEYFRRLGVYVSDCDLTARKIVEKGTPCLAELKETFGDGIINPDGTLNRRGLGKIVFSDSKKLDLLNRITHKYIEEYTRRELKESGADICALDGAVLIGSPVESMCRTLVVVDADRAVRLRRITERDKLSAEDAEKRLDSQMSDAEFLSHADYIIKNNDNINDLGEQIERIYSEIKNTAKTEKAAEETDAACH